MSRSLRPVARTALTVAPLAALFALSLGVFLMLRNSQEPEVPDA
jgi:hypothetical protein